MFSFSSYECAFLTRTVFKLKGRGNDGGRGKREIDVLANWQHTSSITIMTAACMYFHNLKDCDTFRHNAMVR